MWSFTSRCLRPWALALAMKNPAKIQVCFATSSESATSPSSKSTIFEHDPKILDQTKKPRYILEPEARKEKIFVNKKQQTLSFDDIPGPSSLKSISKFWSAVPVVGTELTIRILQSVLSGGQIGGIINWNGGVNFFKRLFDRHGPVIRLHAAFGRDVVLLSRPEHIDTILESENRNSVRSTLDSIEKYRHEYRSYKPIGPLLMLGSDWSKQRKSMQIPLPTQVLQHQPYIEKICEQLVTRIGEVRNVQDEIPSGLNLEMSKWAIECFSCITFHKDLGLLTSPLISPNSDAGRLLDGLTGATEALRKCEYNFHLWKFMETKSWKDLARYCAIIDNVLAQNVEKTFVSLKDKKLKNIVPEHVTLLESIILKEGTTEEDVMATLLDMFLVGTNAVTHIMTYLLFHLARNPRCQIKIFDEISNKSVTGNLKNLSYIQASIKECSRLNPPISVLSRVLDNNVTVHHYRIPKGTHVVFATHLNSLREDYFEEPQKFKPERWLSNDVERQTSAGVAFRHGPNSELIKDMAEMQIAMLLIKICRKYKIEYNYGDISGSHEFLAATTKPLRFRFVDRIWNADT